MIKKIYFHGSLYVLLLFILINKDWKKALFIFSNNTVSESVIRFFQKQGIKYWILADISKGNIFKQITNRLKLYREILKIKKLKKVTYYGSENADIAKFFVGRKFIPIEDGTVNYVGLDRIKKFAEEGRFMSCPGCGYLPYGYDEAIKSVYLTSMFEIPIELKDKSKIVEVINLWNNKTENEKTEILKMFGVGCEILKKYNHYENVLLTQPFESVGVVTEKQKIKIYKKILSHYNKSNTLIKPHPRETTNYLVNFPNCGVVKEKFPFELMMLVCSKVKKVITVSSTGAFSLGNNVSIDLYDICGKFRETVNTGCNIDKVLNVVVGKNIPYKQKSFSIQKFVLMIEGYIAYIMVDRK